ncbi:MAG: hypothetical protein KF729_31875 [Sandaracinaceae bacterium]|nr:hypothetical protein [Sandaracinaceae bacterium]
MAWLVMTVSFLLWALANLAFAFVDPPPALARFMPRKVWFLFAALPAPWDRRLGMLFNAVLGVVGALYFGRLALLE